ncbi:TipJ family phage tail tip protein [Escherichia coli]|uniref:TipJ family phage tail tip protein n=1 Tax=Escherichia coli TaxID=562 RepID=UPI004043A308
MTEKDITIKAVTSRVSGMSVVVGNLPPRPFSIRMRRMTPDSTTDRTARQNALVVIHRKSSM